VETAVNISPLLLAPKVPERNAERTDNSWHRAK